MTRQATPVRGPDGVDVIDLGDGRVVRIGDRRTGRAWNRDTAAVKFSCSKRGYGDGRARQLTLALGRVVGA